MPALTNSPRDKKRLGFPKRLLDWVFRLLIGPTDERDLGRVAAALAKLERTGIAAVASFHAGTDFLEELLERFVGTDGLGREAARMEVAPLGEGDQAIREPLEVLGDARGDLDFLMDDEVGHDVAEHRLVLRGGVTGFEANAGFAVDVLSALCCH